ncbi:MAG: transcription termination/antitermination protein NusG [Candidatus Binatia bacterium]
MTWIVGLRCWHVACSLHNQREGEHVQDLQRDWYVVYSKPHKEELTQFHLGIKGVESFFPRLHLPGPAKKKKRIIPLFPSYLFVRIDLATEAHYVTWSPGVKRIISFGDSPIPVEESVVTFLKEQANPQGIIQAQSQLKRGQEVEISGGPFNGLLGIIQDPPDARGRVKVLLKLLSRQISVRLGVEFIKGDWAAFEPADIGPGLLLAVS